MTPGRPVVLGLSCGLLPPDPIRPLFKGKPLAYGEGNLSDALAGSGALPMLLPKLADLDRLAELIDVVDALVLSGGTDVSPEVYGEVALRPEWSGDPERDRYERHLIAAALAAGKPILGVCRGAQILNAALGGGLYQDIATQVEGALRHRDWDSYDDNSHTVTIDADSFLAGVYGPGALRINSVHHQAIRSLAPGFRAVATAPDGIIEALERIDDAQFLLGVQWHPEWLPSLDDPRTEPRREPLPELVTEGDTHTRSRAPGAPLFAAFIAAVAKRRDFK
ncbi:MAG: gamma-glutamyl-gamma-aminobutyrate hydrolase family protein [Nannocystis sp.]|nr:gamma-glutamyl-gamma-aminobutyrate hydrolase family protein [Nannocystis sp.]MBA3547623.1 gamma-glutamyl-gamma-aminobutyrate hydrolase family protein [Nannocystis sp.]